MKKKQLGIVVTVLWIVATGIGMLQMTGRVRLVDILALFFGGLGCGAGLVKTIVDLRKPQIQKQ
jgi:hypothetical protein